MNSSEKNMYALVQFKDLSYSTVPSSWLTDDKENCRWPNSKSVRNLIIRGVQPGLDWKLYEVNNIFKTFDTYEEAFEKEKYMSSSSSSSSSELEEVNKVRHKNTRKLKHNNVNVDNLPQLVEEITDLDNTHHSNQTDDDANNETNSIQQAVSNLQEEIDVTFEVLRSENLIDSVETLVTDTPHGKAASESHSTKSKTIDEYFLEIKNELKVINERLHRIETKLQTENVETEKLPTMPFENLRDIVTFDSKLESDESIAKAFSQQMSSIGGYNERNCINRCLQYFMTNYVGTFCSWTGQKNNFKLSNLKSLLIIREAVKANFHGVTDRSFQTGVMDWLRHANQRYQREHNNN